MTLSAIEYWDLPAIVCRGNQVVRTNGALLRLFGAPSASDVTGQPFTSLLAESCRADAEHHAAQLNNGVSAADVRFVTQLHLPNGVEHTALVTVIDTGSSTDGQWTAVLTGCEEQSTAGLDLPHCAEEAAHALRMIEFGELTVSLLHDLGQPVTAVKAAGELVQAAVATMDVPEDFRRLVDIIALAGRDLSQRHTVIRNFSRHRRASRRSVSLAELVTESADLVQGKADDSGVLMEVVTQSDQPPLNLDAGLIQLAIVSLLTRTIQLLTSRATTDRRLLVRHSAAQDGCQEFNLEYSHPPTDVLIGPDRFATAKRISELHDGRLVVEQPADDVVRCRLIIR